jgi:hypothetical protein
VRQRLACVLLTVPLALSACGTTVPHANLAGGSQQSPAGASGLGEAGTSSTSAAAGGAPVPGAAGVAGAASSASAGAGPGGSGLAGPGGPVGTDSAAGSSGGAKLRGVTATTIKIGAPVETGTQAAADTFGIKGAGTVSQQSVVKAVIDDVNRSGGVLGRKLVAVFHPFDTAQAIANPDATVAAICADYRDDNPVYAVMFSIPMPGLRKCLAEMGSPLVLTQSISSIIPAAAYDQYGGSYMYGVNSITTDRLAQLFIASLEQRSFHEKWNTTTGGPGGVAPVRLGVIHVDTPDINALYDAYARELAKHGHRFEQTVTYPQNTQDAFAATQGAVLKFKAAGITHVYGASVFFMQTAESQNYRPRYAYLPGLGALGVANAPAAQMKGALTVGWTPMTDVNDPQDPGETPAGKHCRAVMGRAGLNTGSRADRGTMYNICDGLYALRDALAAGDAPTVLGLRRGYEALGSRFPTALTFQSTLGPRRHYGVDVVRDMAFSSECSCLVYSSRTNRR